MTMRAPARDRDLAETDGFLGVPAEELGRVAISPRESVNALRFSSVINLAKFGVGMVSS